MKRIPKKIIEVLRKSNSKYQLGQVNFYISNQCFKTVCPHMYSNSILWPEWRLIIIVCLNLPINFKKALLGTEPTGGAFLVEKKCLLTTLQQQPLLTNTTESSCFPQESQQNPVLTWNIVNKVPQVGFLVSNKYPFLGWRSMSGELTKVWCSNSSLSQMPLNI